MSSLGAQSFKQSIADHRHVVQMQCRGATILSCLMASYSVLLTNRTCLTAAPTSCINQSKALIADKHGSQPRTAPQIPLLIILHCPSDSTGMRCLGGGAGWCGGQHHDGSTAGRSQSLELAISLHELQQCCKAWHIMVIIAHCWSALLSCLEWPAYINFTTDYASDYDTHKIQECT